MILLISKIFTVIPIVSLTFSSANVFILVSKMDESRSSLKIPLVLFNFFSENYLY